MQRCVLIGLALILSFLAQEVCARPGWHKPVQQSGIPADVAVEIKGGRVHSTVPVTAYPKIEEIDTPGEWLDLKLDPAEKRMLTLESCIKMAMERNRRLIAAGYDIEAAENQLMEARATLWPVIEYKYRMAPVPQDVDDALNSFFKGELTFFQSIHVGIGVPVMTFGRLHTAKRLAQGGVDAAKLRLSSLREDTIYQVKKIYYGIQLASETIRLLREAVNQLAKKIDDDADRELKQMDPYNTLKLKIFKSELENRIDEAQNNLELAYEGLRIQLDLEPEAEIKIDSLQLKPLLHEMEEERRFIETAMEHQPESKLLDIGVETRRRQYKLERLNLLPTAGLGFFADIGRAVGEIRGLVDTDDFNNPFNYSRAGLGFQFSGTLDFHGAVAKIRKAKAEYYKASYERLIARRGLSLEMKQAYLDTQRKRKEVSRAKKSESMAQQMVFLSKMNSDMGIGDDKDYAEAVKLLLVNRGQYFKTVFDFNMALANLEKKIGNSHFGKLTSVSDRPDYEVFGGDDDFDVHYKDTFFDEDHVDMEGRQNEDGI